MWVAVKDLSGAERRVEARPDAPVKDVARQVSQAFGLPSKTRCALFFRGRKLPDGSSLQDAGVEEGSLLVLIGQRQKRSSAVHQLSPSKALKTLPLPLRSFNPPLEPPISEEAVLLKEPPGPSPRGAKRALCLDTLQDALEAAGRVITAEERTAAVSSSAGDRTSVSTNHAVAGSCTPNGAKVSDELQRRNEGNDCVKSEPNENCPTAEGSGTAARQLDVRGPAGASLAEEQEAEIARLAGAVGGDSFGVSEAPAVTTRKAPPNVDSVGETDGPKDSAGIVGPTNTSDGAQQCPLGEDSASVELPPALDDLEQKFALVSTVCGFLAGQMVPATWQRVRAGLARMEGQQCPRPITFEDLEAMAALAPQVLRLVAPSAEVDKEVEKRAFWDLAQSAHLANAAAAVSASDGAGSGSGENPRDDSSAGGAGEDGGAGGGNQDAAERCDDVVVELIESWPPLRYEWGTQAVTRRSSKEDSGEVKVEEAGGGACGSEGGPSLSMRGAAQTKRLSAVAMRNRVEKRQQAFHAALCLCADRVHADWLFAQGGASVEAAVKKGRKQGRRNSSARGVAGHGQLRDVLGSGNAREALRDLPLAIFVAEAQSRSANEELKQGDANGGGANLPRGTRNHGGPGPRTGRKNGTETEPGKERRRTRRTVKQGPDTDEKEQADSTAGTTNPPVGEKSKEEGESQVGRGVKRGKRKQEGTDDVGADNPSPLSEAEQRKRGATHPGDASQDGSKDDGAVLPAEDSKLSAREREKRAKREKRSGEDALGSRAGKGGKSLADAFEENAAGALSKEERRELRKQRGCSSHAELTAEQMLEHLRTGLGARGQIVHCEQLKRRTARYKRVEQPLARGTLAVLANMGIARLYLHQAKAITAALNGENVVVATPTASGKSLCYNIPVIEAYQRDTDACALYLFPTKALTQDQLRALEQLMSPLVSAQCGAPEAAIYDGDTPFPRRSAVRASAKILLTNPDMLHMSILPYHKDFSRLLSNLKYVVVDEAHSYTGAFGCHTALILRRLRRICARAYGAHPAFIVCSATCANAEQHARDLVGETQWCTVGPEEDGSPCGDKTFVLWNPPLMAGPKRRSARRSKSRQTPAEREPAAQTLTRRCSPIAEVAWLLAEMVQHNLRCLAFCKTRKLSELVLSYTQEMLKERAPDLVNSLVAYRSGYSADDRRRIERELFGGSLRAVAATNALELGVDIGSLDATIHLGFQGTVASLWQQAGRAGRREKAALSIYVAFNGPLDQYFMACPDRLFARPIEAARVDSLNPEVLRQQLLCAAAELPLLPQDDAPFFYPAADDPWAARFGRGLPPVGPTSDGGNRDACNDDGNGGANGRNEGGTGLGEDAQTGEMQGLVKELVAEGLLGRNPTDCQVDQSWRYIGPEVKIWHSIKIRAIDPHCFAVIDEGTGAVMEEIEEKKAFFTLFEGAVYMQQGKTYIVFLLDLKKREARCRRANVRYYTSVIDMSNVQLTGGNLAYESSANQTPASGPDAAPCSAQWTTCEVTTLYPGFRKVWRGANIPFDTVDLFLPKITFPTQASWIRVPASARAAVAEASGGMSDFGASLHAAAHAVINVLPVFLAVTPAQVQTECKHPQDSRFFPDRILLYDRHTGGIGLASQICGVFGELLKAAYQLVCACPCEDETGCPGCVQTGGCASYNNVLDKQGGMVVLEQVLKEEKLL